MFQPFDDTAFDAVDFVVPVTPAFQKGQIVANAAGQSGVIVASFYNEWSGQTVHTVRVPGLSYQPQWCDAAVKKSASLSAVMVGDMVIADSDQNERYMGQVVGFFNGQLVARFGGEDYLVDMSRVWRVVASPVFARLLTAAA